MDTLTDLGAALRLAVAALSGMAVGLEREWSGHATGPHARFAGIRTFTLLGALGGLAGWLVVEDQSPIATALLLGAALLIVAAYVLAARRSAESIDGTTETAALLVLGTGLLAGQGHLALASGIVALTVLLLGEKDAIRAFVRRIGREELMAALRFAVMALVVLPLLPEGPYGPLGGIRPRSLWLVVLIFSGVNFVGYLARRGLGEARGYLVTGALGGLVSSTAVTLTFSRQSRAEPGDSAALATGTIAACTVLLIRVAIVLLVLNAALAPGVALGFLPMFLVGLGMVLLGRRKAGGETDSDETKNPLRLGSAIAMAIGFQLVLTLLALLKERFGDPGVFASAALAGLTDMDALTFAMSRLAEDTALVSVASRALILGAVVNTVFKMALALVLGSAPYRKLAVPGLLLVTAAGGAGLFLAGRFLG